MLFYAYYVLLAVILLAGVKFAGVKGWNGQFLSLQESKAIQAICAILIIFHHSSQKLEYCKEIQYFHDAGILFVAIFMFCSGYGLMKSLEQKEHYLDHFLKKRLITVIIPFYMMNTLYVLYSAWNHQFSNLTGKDFVKELALRLSGIKLANGNEWFMVVILFLYVLFYVLFKYCKQLAAFVFMAAAIFGYIAFGLQRDHGDCEWWVQGEWWYNTVFLFYVGLLFGKFERTLLKGMKKVYYLLVPVALASCVFVYKYSVKILYEYSYWGEYNPMLSRKEVVMHRIICLGPQIAVMLLFVLSVVLIMMKLHFGNPVLRFMGKISLEVYLIHDLFLQFYRSDHCSLLKSTSYVSAVLLSTIVSATVLWLLSSRITGLIMKKKG